MSKVKVTRPLYSHQAAEAVSVRGKVFTVETYCYVAVCRRGGRLGGAKRSASAPSPQREERGGVGISWRPPAVSLLALQSISLRPDPSDLRPRPIFETIPPYLELLKRNE